MEETSPHRKTTTFPKLLIHFTTYRCSRYISLHVVFDLAVTLVVITTDRLVHVVVLPYVATTESYSSTKYEIIAKVLLYILMISIFRLRSFCFNYYKRFHNTYNNHLVYFIRLIINHHM